MPSEATGPSGPDTAKGLPPVVAPSGRFIAQLFLVPGLIVAGAVVVLLGFSWLAGGNRSPEAFLHDLESTNPDIRWRTASDLAQVLKRDPRLAVDPVFGLKLAGLLHRALTEMERAERSRAESGGAALSAEATAKERKEALDRRSYVQYLTASLGSLMTPVGGPVLAGLAKKSPSLDPKTDALLRRQAVWALASLGEGLQRFAKLPEGQRAEVLEQLDQAADTLSGEQAAWARQSAAWLRGQAPLGVADALAQCANADDPFLRKLTAHALGFWNGTPEENKRIETALVKLAHDDGRGTTVEIQEGD
jgi:hypothetical protein